MRKLLCIKEFKCGSEPYAETYFYRGVYYPVYYEDEYKIVMEYPLTEYQKIFRENLQGDIDCRISFTKDKRLRDFFGHNINEYFSDRVEKLKKIEENVNKSCDNR